MNNWQPREVHHLSSIILTATVLNDGKIRRTKFVFKTLIVYNQDKYANYNSVLAKNMERPT